MSAQALARGLGWLLVAAGLAANPWLLRQVLLDGELQHWREVLLVELVLVGAGVWLIRSPPRPRAPLSLRRASFLAIALVTASAFALGASELALRALIPLEQRLEGDALWEQRWRAAHPGGARAAPLHLGFDRYDPELGWSPIPSYESADVRTNAQGMRADRDVALERSPGASRIVAIGDSYTWGEEVANGETYPAQLEAQLPGCEVLNFGVHGYGIDQALLRLRGDALVYAPDLVVLGFIEDDIDRSVLAFRTFAKPRFALEDGALRLTNVPVPAPAQVLAAPQELPRCYLCNLARAVVDHALDRTRLRPLEGREKWRVTAALLGETKRATEATGARFLLAYFPSHLHADPVPLERVAADWAHDSGTNFVDLRESFARLSDAERAALYRGVHWSPAGNRFAARLLRDAIVEGHLLSPPDHDALP